MRRTLWTIGLLLVLVAPAVFAQTATCYDTCDRSLPCDSGADCMECINWYDTDQCAEWRQDLCSSYGYCGQCAVVREWYTDALTGNWVFNGTVCYDSPFNGVANEKKDQYRHAVQRTYYRTTRCNGVETTVTTGTSTYYIYCEKQRPLFQRTCSAFDPVIYYTSSCGF